MTKKIPFTDGDRIEVSSTTFTVIDKEDCGTGLSLSRFIMNFNVHCKVAHIKRSMIIIPSMNIQFMHIPHVSPVVYVPYA